MFCGELSYKPDEFWWLLPREADNILKGYRRKQEQEYQLHFLLNKSLQETIIISGFLEKKGKEQALENLDKKFSFLKLEQQEEKPKKTLSRAEQLAAWDKIDNKRK